MIDAEEELNKFVKVKFLISGSKLLFFHIIKYFDQLYSAQLKS